MKPVKFPKDALLEVTWEDICQEPSWHTIEEARKAGTVTVVTTGYFFETNRRNGKYILKLSHSKAQNGGCDVTSIPWGTITNVKMIETHGKQDEVHTCTA